MERLKTAMGIEQRFGDGTGRLRFGQDIRTGSASDNVLAPVGAAMYSRHTLSHKM